MVKEVVNAEIEVVVEMEDVDVEVLIEEAVCRRM